MPETKNYTFHADVQYRSVSPHPQAPTVPEPYLAAPALIRAVNLAIYLRRPLLLEGEAGCGKTRLAAAVAYELGLPFYAWPVRSTSRAQEGLYNYDAILRLHDVQTAKFHAETATSFPEHRIDGQRDPGDPKHYRTLGALGKAFDLKACPAVVLIDEIDKADVDFPNDLLAVLDDPWTFDIPETGEHIAAIHKPIVIVTSNKEKGNLPAPFLRRCIYYYIEFPSEIEQLEQIINLHYAATEAPPPTLGLIKAAAARFLTLRSQDLLHKKPGTSEFLDWLKVLHNFQADQPFSSAKLADVNSPFPYPELLFKLRLDWQRFATGSGVL